MDLEIAYIPYTLDFREPGGTSRGVLFEKLTYFIRICRTDRPNEFGYGEAPVFPGLSSESPVMLENRLKAIIREGGIVYHQDMPELSSLKLALETAFHDLNNGNNDLVFPSAFTDGETEISINGLVWMGTFQEMKKRALDKLEAGFKCIKIKIGAINRKEELELIKFIRDAGGPELIIRVDANGAFNFAIALEYLNELKKFSIHSIEQPLPKGTYPQLKELCKITPVPIALDEDLIGIPPGIQRSRMLEYIKPHFIVLKPAFCYGFSGTSDWIERAESLGIGWWITSALESSVGLNAIAQFTGCLKPSIFQGLGTGNLFTNNLPSTLILQGENLKYSYNSNNLKPILQQLNWIN